MAQYQIYLIGPAGRLRLGEPFEATSDSEAIQRTRAVRRGGRPAELWRGSDLVYRMSANGDRERP